MVLGQLSPKGRDVLERALDTNRVTKGLIILSAALGGAMHLIAGEHYEVLFGDDVAPAQQALHELADQNLIAELGTGGWMVTPLGCQMVWSAGSAENG